MIADDRVLLALSAVGTLIGASFVVLSQAVFSPFADTIERVLGGSVLLAAAWLIIRWTFRLIREVRAISKDDREAAVDREQMLMGQLAETNKQLSEVRAQLSAERQLRLSLEQLGLKDRRHE